MEKKAEILVGRREEKEILNRLYLSNKAEFLAIYGRRRVGKTFLVREFFKGKGIYFEVTGSFNAQTKEQLENFHVEHCALFKNASSPSKPKSWREAFQQLIENVKKLKTDQKVILFFDELPWLAAAKSGFLSALDYAWNRHLSSMPNVFLIVSGSAASWMLNKVINNTGGLYGRLSAHLRLLPFNLAEVEEYLIAHGVSLPRKQICELYMVTGGIPKYLSYLEGGLSATQNIHNICFKPQSPLLMEFHKLYYSLFQDAESYLQIVRILSKKRHGLNRLDLLKQAGIKSSARSQKILEELEASGFLMALPEVGKKVRDKCYYLSDEYSLFYLNWIEPVKSTLLQGVEKDYWIKQQASPSWKSWAGFAFESLCQKHISRIKDALQIGAVTSSTGYWHAFSDGKKEVEIDLVIDRADQCINLCEIKFHLSEFVVSKSYAQELARKSSLFRERTKTKKALFVTLITPYGAKENAHFLTSVNSQLTLDALF